jgi:hypothetical protein
VWADGDPPGGDEHVRLEPARQRRPMRGRIVRHRFPSLHDRSRGPEERGEHDAVRLVDLAVGERLARRPELGARGHDRHAGTRPTAWVRDSRGGECRDAGRREARPRRNDGITLPDVAAERPDVRAGPQRVGHHDGVVLLRDELDGDDGVRPLGDDASGRDRHRLAVRQGPRGGSPGGNAGDDRKRPRRVGRANREAVHRRAREARQVDRRPRVLGEHAARCLLQRDGLGGQRPDAREDLREGVVDGDGIGHGADGTHGVRSGA